MGVTLYTFDKQKKLRKPVEALEIRHREGERQAIAEVRACDAPENGEFFGFRCVDGRFRLFLINLRDTKDQSGKCVLTGTDAAVAELNSRVIRRLEMKDTTVYAASYTAIHEAGWETGETTAENRELKAEDASYETAWEVLKTIAKQGEVRFDPYYLFDENGITGRVVDMTEKDHPFRGMICTRKKGASNIYITEEGVPYGRVYGIGKILSSEEPPERVTFADVVWSRRNGDPADKPAGQDWVAMPGAETDAEYVYENQREEDAEELLKQAFEDLQEKQKPKAHGSANVGDVEYLPGWEHRKVRLWDMCVIRTDTGMDVETTIINIDRYYVKRQLTKIFFGEEDKADEMLVENQLAELQKASVATARRVGGAGAGVGEAKQKIINAEELIQLNAKRIELNGEEIELRATKTEVLELEEGTRVAFNEVGIDLDALQAQITLKASQTQVDNLGNTVSTMNATLKVHAEEIEARVEKDGVISSINQTAEGIKIEAAKIDLVGYVTASQLSAEIADIQLTLSDSITTRTLNVMGAASANSINASSCSVSTFRLAGEGVTLGQKEVLTGASLTVTSTGGTVTGVKLNKTTSTIMYLEWD